MQTHYHIAVLPRDKTYPANPLVAFTRSAPDKLPSLSEHLMSRRYVRDEDKERKLNVLLNTEGINDDDMDEQTSENSTGLTPHLERLISLLNNVLIREEIIMPTLTHAQFFLCAYHIVETERRIYTEIRKIEYSFPHGAVSFSKNLLVNYLKSIQSRISGVNVLEEALVDKGFSLFEMDENIKTHEELNDLTKSTYLKQLQDETPFLEALCDIYYYLSSSYTFFSIFLKPYLSNFFNSFKGSVFPALHIPMAVYLNVIEKPDLNLELDALAYKLSLPHLAFFKNLFLAKNRYEIIKQNLKYPFGFSLYYYLAASEGKTKCHASRYALNNHLLNNSNQINSLLSDLYLEVYLEKLENKKPVNQAQNITSRPQNFQHTTKEDEEKYELEEVEEDLDTLLSILFSPEDLYPTLKELKSHFTTLFTALFEIFWQKHQECPRVKIKISNEEKMTLYTQFVDKIKYKFSSTFYGDNNFICPVLFTTVIKEPVWFLGECQTYNLPVIIDWSIAQKKIKPMSAPSAFYSAAPVREYPAEALMPGYSAKRIQNIFEQLFKESIEELKLQYKRSVRLSQLCLFTKAITSTDYAELGNHVDNHELRGKYL